MARGASERPEDDTPTGALPTVHMPTLRTAQVPIVSRHAASPAGDSSSRRTATGVKRTLMTGAPRATKVLPAIDLTTLKVPALRDLPERDSNGPAERAATRRVTRARPIRPEDTAVVERTTRVLRAIQLVEPVEALPAALEEPLTREPVTVVPRTQELPVVWTPAPPRGRRPKSMRHHAALWALAVVAIAATITAISPLGRGALAQTFAPRGVQLAAGNPNSVPSGPWASMSGAADVLGIGGGAGPGVSAPGSAGLPVSKTVTTAPPAPKASAPAPKTAPKSSPPTQPTQPPAPAPAPPSGISSPLVQPWPPSDPYMAVPGHYAFAVSPNGYYSWAFGQCTWWAQDKRQDENLTHMGNAEFWASDAAARGYRVGSTAVRGATAVFQPGVQGAGGAGHVAHVEAVYPDGWFLISEMNFYWNGGGWGRVDYRFAHTGAGVQFIY